MTYSQTSVHNLMTNTITFLLLLQAMCFMVRIFRANGYHNKSLSDDTDRYTPNLVAMAITYLVI
jgi:hypothetical protein